MLYSGRAGALLRGYTIRCVSRELKNKWACPLTNVSLSQKNTLIDTDATKSRLNTPMIDHIRLRLNLPVQGEA